MSRSNGTSDRTSELHVKPTGDAMSQLLLTILSGVAEFERAIIRDRVVEAQRWAKSVGSISAGRSRPGPPRARCASSGREAIMVGGRQRARMHRRDGASTRRGEGHGMTRKSNRDRATENAAMAAMGKPIPSQAKARILREENGTGPWRWVVEGGCDLSNRIGRDLFAAFLRVFQGADRVVALQHLIQINGATPAGEVASNFNSWLLFKFIGSTIYETAIAIHGLRKAGIESKLNDQSAWAALEKLAGQWRGNGILSRLRNTHGFHLGEDYEFQLGLCRVLGRKDTFPLVRGDGLSHDDSQPTYGVDTVFSSFVLFEGTGMTPKDVEQAIQIAILASAQLPPLITNVFHDVLTKAGIEFVPPFPAQSTSTQESR